jgi:hypothetical protein
MIYKYHYYPVTTFVLLSLLFTACHKSDKRNNEITKIELAYDGASMLRNGSAMSVDSSLTYSYFGDDNTQKEGFYSGKITQGLWDTLNMKFEHMGYKTLDITEQPKIPDVGYFELVIHWHGGTTHLFRLTGANTDCLLKELQWLQNSYKMVKLHAIKDNISFSTTLQNPPPIPPISKDFRFVPPSKKVREVATSKN